MSNFDKLLKDLEEKYPKHNASNFVNSNYGRPMRVEMKDGTVFGVLWFRWEDQNKDELNNHILCFNSGNRDIDKLKLSFEKISSVSWD
jgi:hypothetical protein